jgi:hypothetical protein
MPDDYSVVICTTPISNYYFHALRASRRNVKSVSLRTSELLESELDTIGTKIIA